MSETVRRTYPNTALADADRHDLEQQDWHVKREQWTPEGFTIVYERGEDWGKVIAVVVIAVVILAVVLDVAKNVRW